MTGGVGKGRGQWVLASAGTLTLRLRGELVVVFNEMPQLRHIGHPEGKGSGVAHAVLMEEGSRVKGQT